jgi:hypothetical protein
LNQFYPKSKKNKILEGEGGYDRHIWTYNDRELYQNIYIDLWMSQRSKQPGAYVALKKEYAKL